MSPATSRRRGAAMMVALVVVTLVGILSVACLRECLRHDRQLRRENDARQAQWLAESALQRARAAIAKNADYRGETWKVSVPQPSGDVAGTVDIQIKDSRLTIDALFPADPIHGARQKLSVTLSPEPGR